MKECIPLNNTNFSAKTQLLYNYYVILLPESNIT